MICFPDRIKRLKQYILTSVYILSFCVYGVLKCIDSVGKYLSTKVLKYLLKYLFGT